jgi:hypothetical protein
MIAELVGKGLDCEAIGLRVGVRPPPSAAPATATRKAI